MSLNKVMIIGRLGRDPEIRYTAIGLPVLNFRSPPDLRVGGSNPSGRATFSAAKPTASAI